jgi:hypothetical protein
LFWYYKEFSTAVGVGKVQASQAFDWWAKQPEFEKMVKQMMVIDLWFCMDNYVDVATRLKWHLKIP